ncbi:MAG: hypothetical protein ACXVZU_03460 [Methanobacteriaceae archaeon]
MSESKKEENIKSYCAECGAEKRSDSAYCDRCEILLNPKTTNSKYDESKIISRTIELVLGIWGGSLGLVGGIFTVTVSSSSFVLGVSAIIASTVGIVGAILVINNPKPGGVVLIISAIWLIISNPIFGVPGTILLVIAGLLAVIRK